jgi:hypothetical protein
MVEFVAMISQILLLFILQIYLKSYNDFYLE